MGHHYRERRGQHETAPPVEEKLEQQSVKETPAEETAQTEAAPAVEETVASADEPQTAPKKRVAKKSVA